MKRILYVFVFFSFGIYGQEKTQKTVFLSPIQPFETQPNSGLERLSQEKIIEKVQASGFLVQKSYGKSLEERLAEAGKTENSFLVEGFYSRATPDSNLDLYIQIYNPKTKKMIDAYSITDDIYHAEGIQLDKNELKEEDGVRIEKLSRKIPLILRSNSSQKENRTNIEYHLGKKELSQKLSPYISSDEKAQAEALSEVFDILQSQITISATKIAKKTNEAPNIVSVISDKQIEDYGRVSINDVLYQLPGFSPAQVNEKRTVSSRGMFEGWNNNHILTLVDGVQHNDLFYGSALTWEITPLNMVKSLEVIRGPGSALYGSNATNGVVSLNTYSGSDLKGLVKLRTRMGDSGTRIYDVLTGNKGILFSHVVSFNSYQTNGNDYTNYDGSGRKDAFGFLQKFPHRDERNNYYLFLKLEGEEALKGLSFQYHRQKWEYQTFEGWLQNVSDFYDKYSEYRDVFIAKYSKNITDKLSQEYVFKINDANWDYQYRALPVSEEYPSGVSENLKTKLDNIFLRAQWTYLFSGGSNLVGGVELNRTQYKGDKSHNSNINMNILGDSSPNPNGAFLPLNPSMEWIVDKPIHKFAPFLQWSTGKILDKKIELTFGVRYDETSIQFRGIDQPYKNWIGQPSYLDVENDQNFFIPNSLLGSPFVPNEKKVYRKTSPRVGLVYFWSDRLTFKAMVGRAFREPAPGELFGVNTYVGGSNNPRKLSPEVIKTSEMGADWSLNSHYNLRANLFDTRFENAIEYSDQDNTIVNAYTLGTRGIETEILGNHKNLTYFLNYSHFSRYMDRNLDSTISTHPKEVTLNPAQTFNVGFTVEWEKWLGSLTLQRQGRVSRRTSDQGTIDPLTGQYPENTFSNSNSYPMYRPRHVAPWIHVNLKLSYKIFENMKLGFQIFNLFNSYQTLARKGDYPYDYIREGRRFLVDFHASF